MTHKVVYWEQRFVTADLMSQLQESHYGDSYMYSRKFALLSLTSNSLTSGATGLKSEQVRFQQYLLIYGIDDDK